MKEVNGRELAANLIRAYEQETKLYERLEQSAAEQRLLLRNGSNSERLAELAERQRLLAERIGRIEADIAPLRERWEKVRDADRSHAGNLAHALDTLLEQLAERIRAIVEIEKQNTRSLPHHPTTGEAQE